MSDAVERVARAICAEKNAFYGEPPCWQMEEGFTCAACGDDPGCRDLAAAALRAMPLLVAEEREACAKVAEKEASVWDDDFSLMALSARKSAQDIAAAIRARGGEG